MNVLVLDPGERVGWCSAVVRTMHPNTPVLDVTGHGIAYLKDAAMMTHQAVAIEKRYDLVIYERWALTAKGAKISVGSRMESSQFVGMVRLCCWLGGVKCIDQMPKVQSPGGDGERALKCGHPSAAAVQQIIAGLPASHDESHDRSALLHLWAWFFREYV